ncbi:glycoside hydrolase 43 family protein [Anaerocolumna aminovalerica]|uniref:glycoside hydrolase family 43 protein n=1 Tax=Anaerocolumna aminovalerica TaxID=1527 RepID=UPI001FA93740|nr:glycoside hydrolase 43 family protein [Anaerocolumna aminovalerica]
MSNYRESRGTFMGEKLLWKADLGDGSFRNPILFADYSDPDVIRVGDTYYMTASSFNYTPGLPLLISKDLVNWKLKNYAVENINYDTYKNPAHAKGIWAPAIRFHHNKFYIYYGMPDEGIFMVSAENPLGKWSVPICVLEGKGLIDPCPFWDEDGNAYVIHGYANSRIGFKSILGIFPMSYNGEKAIGEDKFIFNGTKTQPTIEGPKIYKRDGYYYIFAPAGGVKTGWQTVLRSENINGPYDERIVMHQGATSINGPHQGGLVDTPSNEEWFLHFQDKGVYGRIVHLQPVRWRDGWPVIGESPEETSLGEPVLIHKKPGGNPVWDPAYLDASDDFKKKELSLQWQWLGNHRQEFYSLSERMGYLRMYSLNPSGNDPVTLWQSSNVLTQKIVCPSFKAEIKMGIQGLGEKEQAGMVLMGGQYAYLAVRKKQNNLSVVYVESFGEKDVREEKVIMERLISNDISEIIIKLIYHENKGEPVAGFCFSVNDGTYIETGYTFVPSKHTWVGSRLGLFSIALDNKEKHGYADFAYLKVDAFEG